MTGDRDILARWVSDYDAQGWHRSGSATDRQCARWIAEEMAALGVTAHEETFPFSRLAFRRAEVRVDGSSVPAVPLFDSPIPPGGAVEGRLGPLGSSAEVAVAGAGPTPSEGEPLSVARRNGRHRAIVAVSSSPNLALRNAESLDAFGVPVVQVAGRHADLLQQWVETGSTATVEVAARRVAATAINVIASVEATHPEKPPVMVLTPRSGWWHCAAERGGGLACWLAALGDSIRHPPRRTIHFVATSGHELAYAGFHAFLQTQRVGRGAIWLHLGANIGARGGALGVASSDPGLGERVLALLSGTPGAPEARPLPAPVGEGGELHRLGANVVSVAGTNSLFHQRADRYPENVDVDALHHISSVVTNVVRYLSGGL